MIFEFKNIMAHVHEKADVCVIGSGAGGAVVAKELAEAGFKVAVLEEGGYFRPEDFRIKPIQVFPLMYRNNSFLLALGFPSIPVSVGKSIGGTTTVNSCTCFRISRQITEMWEREHGITGLSYDVLEPLYERVEKIINVAPGEMEYLGNNALVLKKGAEILGLSGAPIMRNVKNCKGCGVCQFGCPEGAKQSMDVTYVQMASKAGANVYADCKATKINVEHGKVTGVGGEFIDRENPGRRFLMNVESPVVIVACGAIYTPLLLFRNRLCNRHDQVGKNLHLHPGTRVSALFEQEIMCWKGISQSYYVDTYRDEGILIEATAIPPAVHAPTMPFSGMKFKELMAKYNNLANVGFLISDSSAGRVAFSYKDTPVIFYRQNKKDYAKAIKGIEAVSKIFFAAGAKEVYPPVANLPVFKNVDETAHLYNGKVRRCDIEYMAFHPMGTCRMGEDRKKSVVNSRFESHEINNLFICDASILPTSPGVNPQLTIMALATHLANHLIRSI